VFLPKFRKAIKRVPEGHVFREKIMDYDEAFRICSKVVEHWRTKNEAHLHLEGDVRFFVVERTPSKEVKLTLKLRSR
jgi:predicted dithiol-disulfide oxidoreductase (DUF899 family)